MPIYSMSRDTHGRPVLCKDGQDLPGDAPVTLFARDVAKFVDAFTGYGYAYAKAQAASPAPAEKVAALADRVARLVEHQARRDAGRVTTQAEKDPR
jgi:hypothetical protein